MPLQIQITQFCYSCHNNENIRKLALENFFFFFFKSSFEPFFAKKTGALRARNSPPNPENLDLKRDQYNRIDTVVPSPGTLRATFAEHDWVSDAQTYPFVLERSCPCV